MDGRRGLTVVTLALCALLLGGLGDEAVAQAKPEGEMRWALYVTLSPLWFEKIDPYPWSAPLEDVRLKSR